MPRPAFPCAFAPSAPLPSKFFKPRKSLSILLSKIFLSQFPPFPPVQNPRYLVSAVKIFATSAFFRGHFRFGCGPPRCASALNFRLRLYGTRNR
jgi:hypothetical protein